MTWLLIRVMAIALFFGQVWAYLMWLGGLVLEGHDLPYEKFIWGGLIWGGAMGLFEWVRILVQAHQDAAWLRGRQ